MNKLPSALYTLSDPRVCSCKRAPNLRQYDSATLTSVGAKSAAPVYHRRAWPCRRHSKQDWRQRAKFGCTVSAPALTEPRSQRKGDCNARPDVSRRQRSEFGCIITAPVPIEPRSQRKGDCNARPDVSRRSISLNTHRNTARRPNSNALCKKPVQYQLMQFRHSVIINVYTKSTSNEIIDNVPIESDFRKFQFSYCFQSLHVNCRPNVTLESIGGFGLNLLNLPPPDPKSWIRHCLKLNLVDRYYKE